MKAYWIALIGLSISLVSISKGDQTLMPAQWNGGVVAHHLLIRDEIERFWGEAGRRYDPDTIILVGPDHFNEGIQKVTTDHRTISNLLDLSFVANDSATEREHSIQIHLPFIEREFPNASIIPLIIRSDATLEEMLILAQRLRAVIGSSRQVLVVASVDFSHYLSVDEAQIKDLESLHAIQNFDYDTLQFYNADHMDSDESLILVSEEACPRHDCSWEIFYHGNANDYIPSSTTTTYFTLFLNDSAVS